MCPVSHPSLRVTALGREELVLAVPRTHPAAQKKFAAIGDLAGMNFILYEHNTAMQQVVDRWFSDLGVEPRISMEMENIEAIKTLVGAGLGASVLPACALASAHVRADIAMLRVKGKPLYRELGLASLDAHVPAGFLSRIGQPGTAGDPVTTPAGEGIVFRASGPIKGQDCLSRTRTGRSCIPGKDPVRYAYGLPPQPA